VKDCEPRLYSLYNATHWICAIKGHPWHLQIPNEQAIVEAGLRPLIYKTGESKIPGEFRCTIKAAPKSYGKLP